MCIHRGTPGKSLQSHWCSTRTLVVRSSHEALAFLIFCECRCEAVKSAGSSAAQFVHASKQNTFMWESWSVVLEGSWPHFHWDIQRACLWMEEPGNLVGVRKGQWQLALSALRNAEVKRRERDVIGFNAAINVCQLVEFYYIDLLRVLIFQTSFIFGPW